MAQSQANLLIARRARILSDIQQQIRILTEHQKRADDIENRIRDVLSGSETEYDSQMAETAVLTKKDIAVAISFLQNAQNKLAQSRF